MAFFSEGGFEAGSQIGGAMRFSRQWIALILVLVAGKTVADIPENAKDVVPLSVGSPAPTFTVRTTEGALRTFSAGTYQKPTVILFYRGGWCPYCNQQLSDLRLVEPKLRAQGFEIVFLSTDRPDLLYSSLQAADIHYTLLSDSQLEAARAFRIAYRVDDATLAKMRDYGIDLEVTTGTKQHELPVPSVFIVDRSGTIRYVYSNADYTVRLGADALWAAASPLAIVK